MLTWVFCFSHCHSFQHTTLTDALIWCRLNACETNEVHKLYVAQHTTLVLEVQAWLKGCSSKHTRAFKGNCSVSQHLDKHRPYGPSVTVNQSLITVQPSLSQVLSWPEAGSACTLKNLRDLYWRVKCFVQKQVQEIEERETGGIKLPEG